MNSQFSIYLSGLPMQSIIDWYAFEDANGDFEDITFRIALEIAQTWFGDIVEMSESYVMFLSSL